MNAQLADQTADSTSLPPAIALPTGLRRVVLTGFMGAGKTTVAHLIAQRLGWNFLDLDTHVEQRASLKVPAIFAQYGEAHFRRLESTALVSALGKQNLVLALGGGTPELLTNRLLLEQTPGTATVFLDAPFPVLFDRCMLQALNVTPTGNSTEALRPLLNDPAAAESRFRARQPLYRRLARVTLATGELTPDQVADVLIDRLTRDF